VKQDAGVLGLSPSLARSARGLARRKLRHGRTFRRLLAEMEARERWTVDQMGAYQDRQLGAILQTCALHVPYYKDLFRRERLDVQNLAPRLFLERIPPLEKSEVRRDPERFLNQKKLRLLLTRAYSSGTTGSPLVCWRSVAAINFENAMVWRQRRWAGFGFHDRRVTLRGELPVPVEQNEPPYWQFDAAERQLIMSSYHLSSRTVADYAAALAEFAPQAIEGYPSSVAALARLLQGAGYPTLDVRAIFTSSETLLDNQREIGQAAFNAPFFDLYGNAERTAAICSCEHGSYHILPDYSVVEFLDNGEIVGSPLFNHAFPLLRYRSGDTVQLGDPDDQCGCGRSAFPLVKGVLGRLDSYVVTPDGRYVGRLDHIYKGVGNIVEGQIVQESVNRVILMVVRAPGYGDADEALLVRHAKERLGPGMEITVEHVTSIPRTARGKFVAVIGLGGHEK